MELIIPALGCLSLYLLWRTYLESMRPRIPTHEAVAMILAAIRKNQALRSNYTQSLQFSRSKDSSPQCCCGREGEMCTG